MTSSLDTLDIVDALDKIKRLTIAAQMAAGKVADRVQANALDTLLDVLFDEICTLRDDISEEAIQ
ncbi:hypothetical protein [Ferirhizobium litorale]|uniref:Uncharacterized protein n=1 Tax=Ferirhizobium litorale TaxID=2927786 RepID=A0AAE3Q9M4_9HYPH|nr:hypothetical protein [Fererhizobium litorale]MDI7921752.1 hypothetical protein [Fererhizobium litorale]